MASRMAALREVQQFAASLKDPKSSQPRKPKPKSIEIPLRPSEKPVDLPEQYQKMLRNELDARYLESIGAAPSKANIAMVRKHLPADKCKIETAWKSRGWVSDTLFIRIQDPSQAPSLVAARRQRERMADIGAIDRLPSALHASTAAAAAASPTADAQNVGDDDDDATRAAVRPSCSSWRRRVR